MNRLDYLYETVRGNISMLLNRYSKRMYFNIELEPKQKSSITVREKEIFQKEVFSTMQRSGRRAYRSPLIIEMDFFPSRRNPPGIQHLPKNYLDLLGTGIEGTELGGRKLLFNDDRQVDILVVNYHVSQANTDPSIRIKVDSMSNFLEDLKLLAKIKDKDFKEEDDLLRYDFEDLLGESIQSDVLFDQRLERLKEIQELKEILSQPGQLNAYESMEKRAIHEVQEAFLSYDKIKVIDLLRLFPQIDNDRFSRLGSQFLNELLNQQRRLIFSRPFAAINNANPPTQRGDTRIFKENIRLMMEEYRHRYRFLFPLYLNMSLTIFYVPPSTQEIDLDNLARYIVPYVNQVIRPPSNYLFGIETTVPGFPRHTITQYQVIRVPRTEHDPEDGIVRLALNMHDPYQSIWSELDDIISNWCDKVD